MVLDKNKTLTILVQIYRESRQMVNKVLKI